MVDRQRPVQGMMPTVTPSPPQKPQKRSKRQQTSLVQRPSKFQRQIKSSKAEPDCRKPAHSPAKVTPEGRNSVRIIAGAWRGRRVNFPDMPALRPTPDRVRETLFNWLQHSIADMRCLDLFAGSGALGLEALSRGAKALVFVEQAQMAARGLTAELARLGGTSRARVVEMGASRFLRTPGDVYGAPFDVVFLDPPYRQGALAEFIPLLDAGGWIKPGGLVYLENERDAGVPALPSHWELLKSKSAGEVGYHLARANARLDSEQTG
jgi:16S rRNA (guanine966-N2)-methyltransferase